MSAPSSIAPHIGLEHVFDYHADLESPVPIGPGPYGMRLFWQASGGRVDGPRLSGEILPGGGDWSLTRPDGWTRIDVRGQCRTDDGALLYFQYRGLAEPNADVIRVAIDVETGDPRYAWLTQSVLVGRGRMVPGPAVEYRIFRIA